MKSYLALICGVLLVGALCAVLAAPSSESDSSASSSSSSSSNEEEPVLTFPEYTLDPSSLLEGFPDDISVDLGFNEGEGDDDGSGQPKGRTLFLLLRLLQLLSNSTLLG